LFSSNHYLYKHTHRNHSENHNIFYIRKESPYYTFAYVQLANDKEGKFSISAILTIEENSFTHSWSG